MPIPDYQRCDEIKVERLMPSNSRNSLEELEMLRKNSQDHQSTQGPGDQPNVIIVEGGRTTSGLASRTPECKQKKIEKVLYITYLLIFIVFSVLIV